MQQESNRPRSGLSRAALMASLVMAASGCTIVGPDYHPPAVEVPANWVEAGSVLSPRDPEGLRAWWRAFDDPMLDRLVDQALDRNQDLDIALARLRQARAERIQ
ncbi:RND transporter, partial [Achromobacter ruhlandii]|nr:RND transporter [Achromobacter ruhlandii]